MFDELTYRRISGGVTAPAGFQASGVAAQVRKKGRRDLALLYSETPAAAAGIYTQNVVQAAPVRVTRENLANGRAQAVIANSGIANACTGEQGRRDARQMAATTAQALGIDQGLVAVASTGVIGEYLPMDKVVEGIGRAAGSLSYDGGKEAAEAIMTTDTSPKEVAVQLTLDGKPVKIGAMAKGSGMIHPNMATMLGFITTDAAVEPQALRQALRYAADRSFNAVTIDGDTSTNDMVLLLANGRAGNRPLTASDPNFGAFQQALLELCVSCARLIAADGEGATKLMEVWVKGAPAESDARLIARSIARSNLVKAALFGNDPNWGRVICAAGYAGVPFNPDNFAIWLGDLLVAEDGRGLAFDEAKAVNLLNGSRVTVTLDLKQGGASAAAWGCDLTYDYVRINGQYRT